MSSVKLSKLFTLWYLAFIINHFKFSILHILKNCYTFCLFAVYSSFLSIAKVAPFLSHWNSAPSLPLSRLETWKNVFAGSLPSQNDLVSFYDEPTQISINQSINQISLMQSKRSISTNYGMVFARMSKSPVFGGYHLCISGPLIIEN